MQDRTDHPQLRRLAAILNVMGAAYQPRTTLLEQLAEHYPADPDNARRAFERDLDALGQLGFHIEKHIGRPPRYALRGHPQSLPLSGDEIQALAIIRDTFGAEHPHTPVVRGLLERLLADRTPEERALYERRSSMLMLVKPVIDYSPYYELIAKLEDACNAGRMIHFTYQSTDKEEPTRHRKVEPYAIEYYERHFYLVGYSHTAGRDLEFRIDRIRADLDFGFLPDQIQTPQRLGVTFRYRLSPILVRAGISQRFQNQRIIEPCPDGSVIIEATGRNPFFIIQTLIRYRSEAEILDPPFLRARMRDEVRKLWAVYEGDEA